MNIDAGTLAWIEEHDFIPPDVRAKHPTLHFCPEWDLLLIDDSMPEFHSCLCFDEERYGTEES